MNETDLEGLLEHYQNGTTWVSKCVDTLLKSGKFAEITEGLVTQHGSKPVEFLKDAWNARGIDIATCYEYCSRQNFPMVRLDTYNPHAMRRHAENTAGL